MDCGFMLYFTLSVRGSAAGGVSTCECKARCHIFSAPILTLCCCAARQVPHS
jgi:hypothetical protein